VIDRFKNGTVYRETEIERTDLEAIINGFMYGQFNDPVRVVAFNTLEHWADDVSKGVAQEIQTRCDIAGEPVPEHTEDFVDTYTGPTRQLSLRLCAAGECRAFQRKKPARRNGPSSGAVRLAGTAHSNRQQRGNKRPTVSQITATRLMVPN
jgi:hypothetical protein